MNQRQNLYEKLLVWCTPLLFFAWNCIGITENSVAGDEPFSLYFSEQGFGKIIRELFTGNNPPLYETVLHAYALIVGHSIFALRLLSLLFITFAVGISLKTLTKYYSFKHAIVFVLLALGSNFLLKFSHEIRGYGLLILLISLTQYAFLQSFKGNKKNWRILLVLSNILLLYTHYLSCFVLLAQFITLLASKPNRFKNLKHYIVYHLIGFILLAPLIYHFVVRLKQTGGGKTWLNSPEGIEDVYNMLWKFSNKPVPTLLVLLLFAVSIVTFILRKKKTFTLEGTYLFIAFPVLFLGIFLLSFSTPLFLDRYLSIVILAFYFFVSHCVTLSFKNKGYYIATVVLGISFLASKQLYVPNQRPLKSVHQQILDVRDKGQDIIVSDPQLLPALAYYFNEQCYFTPTEQRSEMAQSACITAQGISIRPQLDLEKLPTNGIILLEGGSKFQAENLAKILSQNTLSEVHEIPEIFKIYKIEAQKNKSETQ